MKFQILAFIFILAIVTSSGIFLYQRNSPQIADTIPESIATKIVDEILQMPVENEARNVEFILNQLDSSEVPAFLTQSFWSLHSHLRLREWKTLFLKQSETFHKIPEKLKNKLISRYCVFEQLNNEHLLCRNLLHQFPSNSSTMKFEFLKLLIHNLNSESAQKIFQLHFQEKTNGCAKGKLSGSQYLAANWLYQISGDFKSANKCLGLMRSQPNSPWVEVYYTVEIVRNDILQGRLSHTNKKLFLEFKKKYNTLIPYEKLMYDLNSAYILYHEGQPKKAIEEFQKIQLAIKNRKMLFFENEINYFISNIETAKKQLPQPKHYNEWMAYTILKNGPH